VEDVNPGVGVVSLDNIAPGPHNAGILLAFLVSAVNQPAYTLLFATSETTRAFAKLASSRAPTISGQQQWKKGAG